MSEKTTIICAYCQDEHPNTSADIAEHIVTCNQRPELGLVLKINLMEKAGDSMLTAIHSMCVMVADIEGTSTTIWEIFRLAQEHWEIAKNVSVADLADDVRSDMQGASDAINDR